VLRIIEHEMFWSSVFLTMADVVRDACSSFPLSLPEELKSFHYWFRGKCLTNPLQRFL